MDGSVGGTPNKLIILTQFEKIFKNGQNMQKTKN
jgi:hypothetical protein